MNSIIHTCPKILYRLIKTLLYIFTIILSLFGLSLIVFSVWYLYEGNQYHLDTNLSFTVASITFIVGVVLLTISMCGFAGVIRESLFLSKLFLASAIFVMIAEVVSVVLINIYKKQILENANRIFENFIVNYVDDDDVRTIVDTIQSNLRCCGITSAYDWDDNIYYSCASISTLACSVPASCCRNFKPNGVENNFFCGVGVRNNSTMLDPSTLVYLNGCKFQIYAFFERKNLVTIGVVVATFLPQFIGILFVVGFILSLKLSKKTAPKLGVPNLIEFHRLKYTPTNDLNKLNEIYHISKTNASNNTQKNYNKTNFDVFQQRIYNDL